jgi:hypothetical protein
MNNNTKPIAIVAVAVIAAMLVATLLVNTNDAFAGKKKYGKKQAAGEYESS